MTQEKHRRIPKFLLSSYLPILFILILKQIDEFGGGNSELT
uniref:Uncharacterized protein n=1 Tax=Arundo donax TaxID=35708 RepID=A0A0A8YWU2_ARUDO